MSAPVSAPRFAWLTEESRAFLRRGYLLPGVSPEGRLRQISERAEALLGLPGFAERFFDYLARGFYSLSSPIWANFGLSRGLPISCFGSYVPDSMAGILGAAAEVGIMSKYGGGTSAYFGDLRPRGAPIRDNGFSEGAVNFLRLFDTLIDVTKQGATRRGSFAAYLPIDHPDVEEFLAIRSDGNPIQNLFFGVAVSDAWLEAMRAGDADKRRVWAKVLQKRTEVGLPYVLFTDNATRGAPEVYRDRGLVVRSSNLCTEIMLPVAEDESFVCDLASMNLATYDAWRATDAVRLLVFFLDAVMTEFIDKSASLPFFERARRFAVRHRALGVGVVGYHSLLQARRVPFGSLQAALLNRQIFRELREAADDASAELARRYGEPALCEGTGRRNTTLLAVAPTTSSAFILGGVSPSVEPLRSNYYVRDLAKAVVTYRNPALREVLRERGHDTPAVWRSILAHDGSVQHLDCLSDEEKGVFATFSEISPRDIIVQAAGRQAFIDQGQSLNLMIHPETPARDLNALVLEAHARGLKSLYYQHAISAAQALNRELLTCSACEA
ncbi:ribonucleoside-diphosphate reductase subunit alpha [Truepera radiovictrix]|uniref:Ribonucleoside-diphosphate reductase, alpha chain n=1 Tax=Truepera radiovictrix (strain DSM 17093 / CIP 108686 / LMG 22925 / RQ-24) TaxID=649638 RepID=D7CXC5_TRURR|nr:ribonucleoside-diphosphate reductase subunit alpha [Truepera radiovictrix]ADI13249.1 ribonucleoside-diphosphate reductase, alpha chain [Truepera radiovictrix DSM 17093]WMT58187.1 ribonucleoside-diphosphate reductase subunit alpha [Truepera radiovictrix]